MEITQYVDFIKEQFKDIATEYGFNWRQQNAGILFLEKKNVTIRFATHYREDGVTFTIYNNAKKQSYSFSTLLEKLGYESLFDILDDGEKQINEEYKGTIKCLIYPAAILLKKHFPALLEGDFSSIGKGNPL